MTEKVCDINISGVTSESCESDCEIRQTIEYDQTASILVSTEERWFFYKVIFIYEFISFSLIAWGIESATYNADRAGCCFALCLGILFGGRLTGGQYNPAVTIALTLIKENPRSTVPFYLGGQFLGAFFGAFLSWGILGVQASPYPEVIGIKATIEALFGECIGTFVLVHFVLCQVHKSTTYTNDHVLVGVLFWIVLYGCIQLSYKSGSVFNPALALSLELFASFATNNYKKLQTIYIYILGPFAGGLIATIFFLLFTKPFLRRVREIKKQHEVNRQGK